MSQSTSLVNLQKISVVEGGTSSEVYLPTDAVTAIVWANMTGTITVTGSPSASPENSLFVSLCNLLGNWTFYGTPMDGSPGLYIQNIPSAVINYLNFLWTANPPQISGPTSSLTATAYTVNLSVPLYFYDPTTPETQWSQQYFNPARYSSKPYFKLQFGTFVSASTTATSDLNAFIGTATYTLNLVVQFSATTIPGQKFGPNDKCFDLRFEYYPLLGQTTDLSSFNEVTLSDRQIQAYLFLFNTEVSSAGLETGVNNLGISGPQYIATRFGTTLYDRMYPANLQSLDQQEFLKNQSWPAGVYVRDYYGHSLQGFRNKTLLKQQGTFYLDANVGALTGSYTSQNLRVLHMSFSMSTSLLARSAKKLQSFAKAS
jgi:hypothetical protein